MVKENNDWKGKKIGGFKVKCGGRCVISPDFGVSFLTFSIIFFPSILNIVFA